MCFRLRAIRILGNLLTKFRLKGLNWSSNLFHSPPPLPTLYFLDLVAVSDFEVKKVISRPPSRQLYEGSFHKYSVYNIYNYP